MLPQSTVRPSRILDGTVRTRRFREDAPKTLFGLMRERRLDPLASWAALVPALALLEHGDLRAEAARQLAAPELRPLIARLLESGGPGERALAAEASSHWEADDPAC